MSTKTKTLKYKTSRGNGIKLIIHDTHSSRQPNFFSATLESSDNFNIINWNESKKEFIQVADISPEIHKTRSICCKYLMKTTLLRYKDDKRIRMQKTFQI